MKYSNVQFYYVMLLIFTLGLPYHSIVAQTMSKQELLFRESEELIYSKPNEALKVGLHLLKRVTSSKEKAKVNFLLARIYEVKGDYNNALTYLFEADRNPFDLDNRDMIEVPVTKSIILRALYFDDQSKKYFDVAEKQALKISDRNDKAYAKSLLTLDKSLMYLDREKYEEAAQFIEKQGASFENTIREFPTMYLWFMITKGRAYCGLNDYEKGRFYFEKVLDLLKKTSIKNDYAEVYALSGIASVYFHQKDHQKALKALLSAGQKAQPFENVYLTESINKQIAINYLALNDKTNYKFYNTNFLKANAEVETIEQESVNTAFNLITQDYENIYKVKKQWYSTVFYIALGLTFVVILVCGLFWFKFQWKKKRLKEIINYLEITRNNLIIRFTEKKEVKEVSKKSNIPLETEQALLNKLKRFESSTKFTNNDMSLAVLAGQFETNTKYLSEIINKHYDVNFNTYINKLRINYIVEKLKSDPNFRNYKISYLAENSGFSSHSSFATVFKSITGIAPITFIELLKSEMEVSNSQ